MEDPLVTEAYIAKITVGTYIYLLADLLALYLTSTDSAIGYRADRYRGDIEKISKPFALTSA